jgi:hypothetical protein
MWSTGSGSVQIIKDSDPDQARNEEDPTGRIRIPSHRNEENKCLEQRTCESVGTTSLVLLVHGAELQLELLKAHLPKNNHRPFFLNKKACLAR